jgi:hypothetical protein
MEKTKKSILGIELALLLIFISSGFVMFLWGNPLAYYLLVVVGSFLGGIMINEFDKSLIILSSAFIVGSILFIFLFAFPTILYGESYHGEINNITAIISTELAKVVIISFPVSVFACLFGCFLGNSLAEED